MFFVSPPSPTSTVSFSEELDGAPNAKNGGRNDPGRDAYADMVADLGVSSSSRQSTALLSRSRFYVCGEMRTMW